MSTTTINDVAYLDIEAIDPDPNNRPTNIDAAFAKSIATHGVIQAITVRPNPDNPKRYRLVAGHRRHAAARKAGQKTIPALIRIDLNDQDAVGVQVVENLQRADLTLTDEVDALTRAIGVGYNVKSLAAAIGRTQKWVKERLALAELPPEMRGYLDNGEWTLADGLAVVPVLDDPEGIEAVLNRKWGSVQSAVEQHQRIKAFETKAIALVNKTTKAGITVLDPNDETKFKVLSDLGIEDDDHQGEPCHAVVMHGRPPSDPLLVTVCTNPSRHTKRGKSEVKRTQAPSDSFSEQRKETERAKREANAARKDAIATALASKLPKAEVDNMIYFTVIALAHSDDVKAACQVLGVEVPKDTYAETILTNWAQSKAGNPAKAAAAITFIHQDRYMRNAWPKDKARKWLKWLKTHTGYKPSAHERNAIKG